MKKNGVIILICAILSGLYAAISLIITTEKSQAFWIGFGFALAAFLLTAIVAAFSSGKSSSAFLIEISLISFSVMYILAVLAINLICGKVLQMNTNVFLIVHLICIGIYALIMLMLFVVKNGVIKNHSSVNGKICEMQILVYEFEKLKSKLIDMQEESQREAFNLLDGLLEELCFSDLGITVDTFDIFSKLRSQADVLASEIDNLIDIKSSDLTSMRAIVNDTKKIIKDRNMQIRLLNSNI